MTTQLPVIYPVRSCGECTACCTVLAVLEIRKDERVQCPHDENGGCAIYNSRPPSCRGYVCAWLLGWGTEDDRPDKLGLVIDTGIATEEPGFLARETRPGAAEASRSRLRRVARRGLRFTTSVGVRKGPPTTVAVDLFDGERYLFTPDGHAHKQPPRKNIVFDKSLLDALDLDDDEEEEDSFPLPSGLYAALVNDEEQ